MEMVRGPEGGAVGEKGRGMRGIGWLGGWSLVLKFGGVVGVEAYAIVCELLW